MKGFRLASGGNKKRTSREEAFDPYGGIRLDKANNGRTYGSSGSRKPLAIKVIL
jgi:hypothetical protein